MINDSQDVDFNVKFCVCWKIVADKTYARIIHKERTPYTINRKGSHHWQEIMKYKCYMRDKSYAICLSVFRSVRKLKFIPKSEILKFLKIWSYVYNIEVSFKYIDKLK